MSATFVGSIPALYDRHLGPVLFEPYARDLARRLPPRSRAVLEVAAGTGRVTRHLLAALPPDAQLLATDLSEAMLACAAAAVTDPRVTWHAADAQALPAPDGTVDVVVCQFGLMFVPDQDRALAEMRRVLRPGGVLLLSTWNALAANPMTARLHALATAASPGNPPDFMLVPFSLHDRAALARRLEGAGFGGVLAETVAQVAEAVSAADVATGLVRGNPLATQLAERGVDADRFEREVAQAMAEAFGAAPCRSPLSAHVFTARA